MRDVRELILTRLLAVSTVDGIVAAKRNRFQLPPTMLPGVAVNDSKERAMQTHIGKGLEATPPLKFLLEPEVWVLLKARANYENEGVGEELSGYRAKIITAVLYDDELRSLVNGFDGNGDIEYRGHETDMQSGSMFLGQMRLDFAFSYVLNPSDLR